MALGSLLCDPTVAQGQTETGGLWDGPYNWVNPPNLVNTEEIAHGVLVGKKGPLQGKVLLWRTTAALGYWVFDPASPSSVTQLNLDGPPPPPDNLFCSVHVAEKDGDIVISGGDRNNPASPPEPNWSYLCHADDKLNPTWSGPMSLLPQVGAVGHYYPGGTCLHDGRPLTIGGGTAPNAIQQAYGNDFEIFDKTQMRWTGPGGSLTTPYNGLPNFLCPPLSTQFEFRFLPLLHLLSDGKLFASVIPMNYENACFHPGFGNGKDMSPSAIMDVSQAHPVGFTWSYRPTPTAYPGTFDLYYASAILAPWVPGQLLGADRVILFGGVDRNDLLVNNYRPAKRTVWQITSPQLATSQWQSNALPPLNHARVYPNAVILPDRTLFLVGGAESDYFPFHGLLGIPPEQPAIPVYIPELLDLDAPPGTASWIDLAPHFAPRLYHSIAILLPDGRVLVVGGYRNTFRNTQPPLPHRDAEIFTPPYLLQGLPRPVIVSPTPEDLYYGTQFTITVSGVLANQIGSVCLIRCASVTHHFDWDQRYVGLKIESVQGNNTLTVSAPSAVAGQVTDPRFIAPPGYYMLFVVSQGVPSVAKFVKLQ